VTFGYQNPNNHSRKTITNAATIITGWYFIVSPSCYLQHFFLLLKQILPQWQPCGDTHIMSILLQKTWQNKDTTTKATKVNHCSFGCQ